MNFSEEKTGAKILQFLRIKNKLVKQRNLSIETY